MKVVVVGERSVLQEEVVSGRWAKLPYRCHLPLLSLVWGLNEVVRMWLCDRVVRGGGDGVVRGG